MKYSEIALGSAGFATAGFCKSVFVNQIGFDLGRAVFQKEAKPEVPVADRIDPSRLQGALGDNGTSVAHVFDVEAQMDAYTAAYVLLVRHANLVDPEDGRKPEHLKKWLKEPTQLVQVGIDWRLKSQIAEAMAFAEMTQADPSKRIEAIKTELAKQASGMVGPLNVSFLAGIEKYGQLENDELVDVCIECLTDAGRNPAVELKRAAEASIKAAKDRFEKDGKYAKIDAGIYALANS